MLDAAVFFDMILYYMYVTAPSVAAPYVTAPSEAAPYVTAPLALIIRYRSRDSSTNHIHA